MTDALDIAAIRARRYDWWNHGAPTQEDARQASTEAERTRDALCSEVEAQAAEIVRLRAALKARGHHPKCALKGPVPFTNKDAWVCTCDSLAALPLAPVRETGTCEEFVPNPAEKDRCAACGADVDVHGNPLPVRETGRCEAMTIDKALRCRYPAGHGGDHLWPDGENPFSAPVSRAEGLDFEKAELDAYRTIRENTKADWGVTRDAALQAQHRALLAAAVEQARWEERERMYNGLSVYFLSDLETQRRVLFALRFVTKSPDLREQYAPMVAAVRELDRAYKQLAIDAANGVALSAANCRLTAPSMRPSPPSPR